VILKDFHRELGVFKQVKTWSLFGVPLFDCTPKRLVWIRHWSRWCRIILFEINKILWDILFKQRLLSKKQWATPLRVNFWNLANTWDLQWVVEWCAHSSWSVIIHYKFKLGYQAKKRSLQWNQTL